MTPKNQKNLKNSSKIDEKASRIEEKSDRFIRVVGKRAQFVIDKLFTMGNILNNSSNYNYNLEQVDLIFQPIEELVAKLKEKFVENIAKDDIKKIYKIDLNVKKDEKV